MTHYRRVFMGEADDPKFKRAKKSNKGAGIVLVCLLVFAAVVGGLITWLALPGQDPNYEHDKCLVAAVQQYPTWPDKKKSIVDGTDECKDLSSAQKARVRKELVEFTEEVILTVGEQSGSSN